MYPTIELKDAVEGEWVVSKDFLFSRIGEPIPVFPRNGGDGDPMPYLPKVPSQALAVSGRHNLLFIAHSSGFLVATFKSVMKEMMFERRRVERRDERGRDERRDRGLLRWRTTLDIRVGRVHLLLLSPYSWTLAACVGGTVNFFEVSPFEFGKEQQPFLSRTIDGESSIKDMTWLNEDSYILLTSCGNLYLGSIGGFLKVLKYNVDAVDCSPRFDYIAMARNDRPSILSFQLKKDYLLVSSPPRTENSDGQLSILPYELNEESHIAWSLQPWTENSDDISVKVDSLKWVHRDRIVLGCFQPTSDGMEGSYRLLVISLTLPVDETSSTQLSLSIVHVQSFPDAFTGIVEDIMPAGSGPHLFFSCLENFEFAIAANRKNVDQHIVLFDWLCHEQMALVYTDRDHLLPRIELQENGDDNSIVGLCTDMRSSSCFSEWARRDIEFRALLEDIEFRASPMCTLWCVSLDGKLRAFRVCLGEERRKSLDIHWRSLYYNNRSTREGS